MGKSIERLAMELAGKPVTQAQAKLERLQFSPAEASEIVTCHWRRINDTIANNWKAIAETIDDTLRLSVTLGERLDKNF